MKWLKEVPDEELRRLTKAVMGDVQSTDQELCDLLIDEWWNRKAVPCTEWPLITLRSGVICRVLCRYEESEKSAEHSPRRQLEVGLTLRSCRPNPVPTIECSCGSMFEPGGFDTLHREPGSRIVWPTEGYAYLICPKAKFADDVDHALKDTFPPNDEHDTEDYICICHERYTKETALRRDYQ